MHKLKKYCRKFLIEFNYVHMYENKPEALFKGCCITICCFMGLNLFNSGQNIIESVDLYSSFLLFSISLIMEYAIICLSTKKFIKKLFPLTICVINFFIFSVSLGKLTEHPIHNMGYEQLRICTFISWIIIAFDVITTIMIEPPNQDTIENDLKKIKIIR